MSSKDNNEEKIMHSKSNNIEVKINDKGDEVIEALFQSLLPRFQIGLETSIKGSDFIFGWVPLLYYKCPKIHFKCCELCIDSPYWIKSRKQQLVSSIKKIINAFNTL